MTLHDSDLSREGRHHKEKNQAMFWRMDGDMSERGSSQSVGEEKEAELTSRS